jgi:uncharacterized coiled-coil protein SlyX
MEQNVIIRTGDKVFTADGRVGKVGENEIIVFQDGTEYIITKSDYDDGFADFYLIGKNFFGNKVSTEEMERRIAEQREVVRTESAKLDALRKQLWTMNERMVPDWRERMEAKKSEQKK